MSDPVKLAYVGAPQQVVIPNPIPWTEREETAYAMGLTFGYQRAARALRRKAKEYGEMGATMSANTMLSAAQLVDDAWQECQDADEEGFLKEALRRSWG